MKKINFPARMIAILSLLIFPLFSDATCLTADVQGTTGLLILHVDPHIAVGEVLIYRKTNNYTRQILVYTCDSGTTNYMTSSPLVPSKTVEGAYETGVAGVGVFIGDIFKKSARVPSRGTVSMNAMLGWTPSDEVGLTFVKTGPVIPGSVGPKIYSRSYLNSKLLTTLMASSLTVIQKSCLASVSSRNQSVDMGTPNRSEFHGVGSTAVSSERNFNIVLECEADNIPVQVTFEPVGNSPGDGMITVGSGSKTASGIAVEVLDSNRVPISFAQAINYHSAGEREIEIPLLARYKQTGTITPGPANAAMTFTITQN